MIKLFIRNRKETNCQKLFFHTDIHSHVCPGIDDGAPTLSKSVELVKGMAALGITKMIVTPHVTDETFPNTPEIIDSSFNRLCSKLTDENISMELEYSAEYRIDDLFLTQLRNGLIKPLPNDYILVENSWLQEPFNLDEILFSIQTDYGLRPILAHPERYVYYQGNRRQYADLHRKGILFQVNLLSLAGHYGKECKSTAEWLLEENMVSFLGSDLHREAHIQAIRRYIGSQSYRKLLNKQHQILNDTAFV